MRPDCHRRRPGSTAGVITVELALVLGIFLLFVLGTFELARMAFVLNTAQDVTRRAVRAAAMTDFTDGEAMASLRYQALFRDKDAALPLLPELTPNRLRIDYLSLSADGVLAPVTAGPACPAQNVVNCTVDPNGTSCIRFVRVRICAAVDGACEPLPYTTLTGLLPALPSLTLPISTSIAKAETLGFQPGMSSCL